MTRRAILLCFAVTIIIPGLAADKRLLLHSDEDIISVLHGLESRFDQLNATHIREVAALQADVQTKTTQITSLQTDLQTKTSQITSFQSDLQTKTSQITSLQSDLQTKTSQITALRSELNAEKNERCRTGTINFHKEQHCSNVCTEQQTVHFSPPFSTIPIVACSLSLLDIDGGHNIRISSFVSSATTSSAVLTVEAWADTLVYSSRLSWIACPSI